MKIYSTARIYATPLALALATALATPACAADFYKCKDGAGRISYQDQPCETGSGKTLDIKQSTPTRRTDISYGQASDSDLAARRDIEAARQLDQDRDAARRSADWDRRINQIDRESDERMDRVRRALNR